jgi:hypothetical protein
MMNVKQLQMMKRMYKTYEIALISIYCIVKHISHYQGIDLIII